MKKNVPITALVSRSTFTVKPWDRLSRVYRLMKRHNLSHVPVVEADKIVGIISRRDILHLGFGYAYEGREDVEIGIFDMLQADQVMVKNPALVPLDAFVEEVAKLLATSEMLALPVIDRASKVTGIIDVHQVVLFLLE